MEFRGTERFRVERQIGSGGMGVVYEAVDTERGARVALKTLRYLDATSLLRFKAEFRALADIHHENLVRFGELYAHDARYFFTMELVLGVDFLSYVRPGVSGESTDAGAGELHAADTVPAASSVRGSVAGSGRPGTLHEARLRVALGQLVRGLAALHAAGKVHRDVKPTNVLVEARGGRHGEPRVVLVDFGLATDANASQSMAEGIAGTVAYMAPEQVGGAVGPAADWYAVGAMLYEALTGQVPFFGSAYEVLATKKTAAPPRPRDIAPDVPDDLDALCTDLLRPDPLARPKDDEIVLRLGLEPGPRTSLMPPSAGGAPFVGRRRELEQLQRAYEQARRGTCVTVYIHGESGLGKTALARHFVAQMHKSDPDVIVLTGRCYERESVPYKAVDGVVDALGRFLLGVRRAELAAILPAASAARLGRAFPVLERLRASAGPEASPSSALDPLERRARVFYAMRDLLHALADAHLVVMLIDDLQWADADSLLLLREIMRSPPASILLLTTVRTEREPERAASGPPVSLPASRLNVGSSTMPGDVRIVHLEPLGEAESRALAEMLIERTHAAGDAPESAADSIVREAAGHPLFIDELVRHAWLGPAATDETRRAKGRAPIRLEDALWSRIQAAEDVERQLLEVLAVARGPLAYDVAAKACAIEPGALDELVAKLRFERLVRTTRMRDRGAVDGSAGGTSRTLHVETYHDRVRRAVLAHLETPEADVHARIASALEAIGDADLEALAEHHRGAGDLARASSYAMRAAEAAAEQLAFDRAARLYDWAMAMRPEAATKDALKALAGALASAGRGPAAAEAYLRAAELETAGDDALELRRLAAHHLLTTGHVREGMDVMSGVMRALDLHLAGSPRRALVSLAAHRARLRLRGLALGARTPSRRELERVDACFTASAGLAHVDTLRGAELQSRGLLLALASGDRARTVRALANEAAYVATAGDEARPRWTALLDRARTIAREADDPSLTAHVLAGEGVALFLSGYWLAARARCEDALRLLRERAPSSTWEIDAATLYSLRALEKLGQLAALRVELPDRIVDAEARGDRFALVHLRTGDLNIAWLAAGDVEGARRELGQTTTDDDAFGLARLQELVAAVRVDLYVGDGARAHGRLVERWADIERSQLLRIQHQRVTLSGLRARAALARARATPDRALLDEAAGFANQLARSGAGWALADAAMLRGCIGQTLGDTHRAAVSFEQALRDYAACDMALHAAVARLRYGKLIGGDDGRSAVTQAREWMVGQGAVDPDALAAVLAP